MAIHRARPPAPADTQLALPFDADCAEINPASQWCQRWSGRRHSWQHRSAGGFDASRYRVEPISENVAKRYVIDRHYSASYPAAAHRYGLFLDDQPDGGLVGVAVYGIPVSTRSLALAFPTLEPLVASIELSRLVLEGAPASTTPLGAAPGGPVRAPGNSESWFLARTFEHLATRGILGVQTFADPVPRRINGTVVFPGHVGWIYMASNATAAGRSTARTLTVMPDGTVLNDRAKQKVRGQERGHEHVERALVAAGARPPRPFENPARWLTAALEDVGATRLRHRGCLRYLFKLGTRRQRATTTLGYPAQPYTKHLDPA